VLTDLEIAQKARILPVTEIAEKAGIDSKFLELYGNYKAKVSVEILKEIQNNKSGKYIDVTAITPTPLGEGKTVTTIGLSQAIGKLRKKVFTCIRQPSLGPVFGIKGRRLFLWRTSTFTLQEMSTLLVLPITCWLLL